jgi:quinol monooxygenase YgiN
MVDDGPRYGICGSIVATEGEGDTLASLLLEAAAALEAAEGCRLYLVNRDPADAERVWVVEVWDSAEHHRASLELPAVQEVIGRARPVIAEMGDRLELEPIGGLGLP